LRSDPLFRQQWQEEDQDPFFYTVSTNGGNRVWKAFCWYRLPDQRIVGLWKNNYMAVSTGSDWIPAQVPDPTQVKSFRWHPGAKVWGERTADGRFAIIGCASDGDTQRRWPLAAAVSEDGLNYTTPFLAIAGDMPPQRYENDPGDDKNCGPQYVRGISPGNGHPPGTDLWLAYSMNKEDVWVASLPTPIVERLVFRTGEFRLRDFARRRHTEPFLTTRLPNADVPEPSRQFDLDDVTVVSGHGVIQQP
jgi:hypothetical protein